MISRHIHIKGLVQGIGFRPHVYRLAQQYHLKGTVLNSRNGVHIQVSGEEFEVDTFIQELKEKPPQSSIITGFEIEPIAQNGFADFRIIDSEEKNKPDLLITPDLGLCEQCALEMMDPENHRHAYAFTTCIHCGPRYSIMKTLPYDRPHTTMLHFEQCPGCREEYSNPKNRRYYSQTNSCADCGITLQLFKPNGTLVVNEENKIYELILTALENGEIVAIKGIGGYLLCCDARNEKAIQNLRTKKHRPEKPLAVLFPSLPYAEDLLEIDEAEAAWLTDIRAPIVVCRQKKEARKLLATEALAPGLDTLGIMMPYAPLLLQLMQLFPHPLVATSGNMHGSPIIYQDDLAIEYLGEISDWILMHNREIVVPQDDSVIRLTPKYRQPVLLRRSRGWAPNFQPSMLPQSKENILAFGAELKSAFAMQKDEKVFISQYLGNQENYESQQAFGHCLYHLSGLLEFTPEKILIDKHPNYYNRLQASEIASKHNAPLVEIQHHEAHFAAVLAENKLIENTEKILGIVWDGTGFGHDGRIWGMEFFEYNDHAFTQVIRVRPFAHLAGDKMSREPRLAALSIAGHLPGAEELLKPLFTGAEWEYYQRALKLKENAALSYSAGRLFDAAAFLLGFNRAMSYEGQSAMWLENLASKTKDPEPEFWQVDLSDKEIIFDSLFTQMIAELKSGTSKEILAWQFHFSLVKMIENIAGILGIKQLAFSGGVFQNTLLVDLLRQQMENKFHLFFHKNLSPNDESIGYGQLAWYAIKQNQIISSTIKS